jgi:hypothetical protein
MIMKAITTVNRNRREQDLLWQKIAAFPIDDPGASFPFSRRLARERNWDYDFGLQAIEEYRKFIFLCCISPHGASPSKVIDEVWHLHLLYTKNYWEDFCRQTLNRNIHHHPSAGGMAEREKHQHWRTATLALYKDTFHTEAPPRYWDDDHLPTPRKGNFFSRLLGAGASTLLPLPLLLTGCDKNVADDQIPFLLFIFIISVASAVITKTGNPENKKKSDGSCSSGDGCSSGGDSDGCSSGCGGCGGD